MREMSPGVLSDGELQRLDELEDVIERGLGTFREVGEALMAIRDSRLYRAEYPTFEEYCQDRWRFTSRRANQMIEAAGVLGTIVPSGLPLPINEGQARELARVPEPDRAEVWRETLERTDGKPTAAAIRETYSPPQPVPDPAPASSVPPLKLLQPEPEPLRLPEPDLPPPPQPAHVTRNTGENEWYTPAAYIKAATAVMGGIDLDPASSAEANTVVGATQYWTAEDDGLIPEWSGRVWMNPPYERGLVDKFCMKLAKEYKAGRVTEAIVLINNSTDSTWFHQLGRVASAVCFPLYRIRFWHPAGKESNPLQGQAILYLGTANAASFVTRFGPFGLASAWSTLCSQEEGTLLAS